MVVVVGFEPDKFGSGEVSLAGCCEHDNEPSDSIMMRTSFATKLTTIGFCAPWN
jgi:hypothetical protein